MLEMADFADRRTEGFSAGMRRRVILGQALVHDPPNVILDEPTAGLDVMSARNARAHRSLPRGGTLRAALHPLDG